MSSLQAVMTLWLALCAVTLVAVVVARAVDGTVQADRWAARRGVTLTERSRPFVEAYLRNARRLRLVGAAGALAVAGAFTHGTGIGVQGIAYAWVLAGYLAGCLWAELAFARVPASSTRVASLVVRPQRSDAGAGGWTDEAHEGAQRRR